ncbi:hypothetical protein J2W27_002389 [Variovorax boronicumulans]|nr:hypothetical protein [Variovorax boronicumulans]
MANHSRYATMRPHVIAAGDETSADLVVARSLLR